MSSIYPKIDPDGLLEYSVVFTDRSMNHMSQAFQKVMRDLHAGLTYVYKTQSCVLVPGGGTFAMESVARQFARDQKVLVVRNGWFSYRWTQIFNQGVTPAHAEVAKARPDTDAADQQFSPVPVDEVCAQIRSEKPNLIVAPHVETSAGMLLPDSYIKALTDAAHKVGALFVLDCVAAGALWVDMDELGVDVLITAPQKGWTSTPCAGIIMLSDRALARLETTTSDSFVLDLKKWYSIMDAYLSGGHAYHVTVPTDGLANFLETYNEMAAVGFDALKTRQIELGRQVRELIESYGFKSLAAEGFKSPTVVVSHTDRADFKNGSAFAAAGLQIAAGVPLECGESADFQTFRIGLFGMDKLMNIDRTISLLDDALGKITQAQ
ncbi:MAG: aminotransferase class V-fold PLP-dependent enzyme [Pseudomonadota bacterium]|nr:aminotransferase class V-fold PLP-dependent enzyme [Pseudomonadota bacterium]